MATVQQYNFSVHQGSDANVRISLTESDSSATDLTGYSVRGVVKHRYSDTTALLDLSPTIVSPATGGHIAVILTATSTKALPVGQFVYDIEKYPDNNTNAVTKVLKGFFNVYPEATT